jgi:NADPH:quinone reductase-like Zn-dependent oxidoreductase
LRPSDSPKGGAAKAYFPIEFPGVIGWDLSGTVLELGSGVKGTAFDDKVFASAFHTYAELCEVKAAILAKIADRVDAVDAAALPLVTITGSQLAIRSFRCQPSPAPRRS